MERESSVVFELTAGKLKLLLLVGCSFSGSTISSEKEVDYYRREKKGSRGGLEGSVPKRKEKNKARKSAGQKGEPSERPSKESASNTESKRFPPKSDKAVSERERESSNQTSRRPSDFHGKATLQRFQRHLRPRIKRSFPPKEDKHKISFSD